MAGKKRNGSLVAKRSAGVTWKALGKGEEGLLLKLKTGDYYTVNEVGLAVWKLADGSTDAEIAAALARRFDISPEAALKDTRSYCHELERAGLLTTT